MEGAGKRPMNRGPMRRVLLLQLLQPHAMRQNGAHHGGHQAGQGVIEDLPVHPAAEDVNYPLAHHSV